MEEVEEMDGGDEGDEEGEVVVVVVDDVGGTGRAGSSTGKSASNVASTVGKGGRKRGRPRREEYTNGKKQQNVGEEDGAERADGFCCESSARSRRCFCKKMKTKG